MGKIVCRKRADVRVTSCMEYRRLLRQVPEDDCNGTERLPKAQKRFSRTLVALATNRLDKGGIISSIAMFFREIQLC